MKFRIILPAASLALLAATQLSAQVVEQVTVIKSFASVQTSAAAPFLDPSPIGPNYGGPYNFSVDVSGTNLSGITAPTVTLPAGSLYPSQFPTRHNGGVLVYNANEEQWGYGVNGNDYGGQSAAERDASFAPGVYGLSVNGTSFNLNFPTTTFPENTPSVTLTGGTWVRGVYMIDVTQPLTITTNAFTNFNQNADGAISLSVDEVIDQLTFYSANHAANNFATATIPANTLVAGTVYGANVGFFAVMDKSTAIANSLIVAAYGRDTNFRIVAYSGTMPSATLYGIGDLPGGIESSEVRDVARVNNLLYAVGSASANSNVPGGRDTAVIWTVTGDLVPLPNIAINPVASNFITASAITPDAAYIASRARSSAPGPTGGAFQAVRVTTSSMTNLSFAGLVGGTNNSAATAISGDGSILYGLANNNSQAVRYTASGPTGTVIPFLPGDTASAPAARGCSLNGAIMVGTSTNSGTGHRGAFRYVQGAGVTAIPFLSGGTWNTSLAVSPDGNLALVFGESPSAPQGEFYLYNATPGSVALTALGTPNGSRSSNGLGGMSADGSVVVGNLNDLSTVGGVTTGASVSYMHNSHGWHRLQAVVAAAGVNLTNWTLDPVEGMSSDGTLVWGMGTHHGVTEGFVVEFAPGYLAAYNEPAVYSTPDQAIVGAWSFGDTTSAAGGSGVLIFYANGYYMHIQNPSAADKPSGAAGFERGQYTWSANTGLLTFKTLLDTNGDIGLSGEDNGPGFTVAVSGNTATATTPDGNYVLTRVTGASPLVGVYGYASEADNSAAFVFLPNGYFYFVQDGDSTPAGDPNGHDGMEWGSYTWDANTHNFVATVLIDTNGQWGMSDPQGAQSLVLSGDLLTLTLTNVDGVFPIPRVRANVQPGDLNSDGSVDAAWSSPASGQRAVWLMYGPAIIGGADLSVVDPSWRMAAVADFNSDGQRDILWQNTTTGERYFWFMSGTAHIGSASLAVVGLDWSIVAAADFTGDNKPDILWQNTTTGERFIWFMDGVTNVGGVSLGTQSVDWSIVAAADFNSDGKPDILWQNTATGERYLWYMSGTAHIGNASLGVVPTAWSLAGAADFNGDNQPDLLWQNTATGERYVWYMNGTAHSSDASLGIVSTQWSMATAADLNADGRPDILWQRTAAVTATSVVSDFNADGKPDILWQNTTTGERYLWFMNGAVHTSDASIGIVSTDWSIAAKADFNADGKPDLLWQNTLTGERVVWFMNGAGHIGGASLGVVSTAWSIAAAADFNADGKPDILWQNTATGERYLWFMDGTAQAGAASFGTIPVEWSIMAAADFNADGKPDVLWQNTTTGERYLWFMNGAVHTSDASLGIVPTAWSIGTTADFNADGKPDILWQNTATGERYLWFMNGAAHTSDASFGTVPLEWKIVK